LSWYYPGQGEWKSVKRNAEDRREEKHLVGETQRPQRYAEDRGEEDERFCVPFWQTIVGDCRRNISNQFMNISAASALK
jgi:hypothetical protein